MVRQNAESVSWTFGHRDTHTPLIISDSPLLLSSFLSYASSFQSSWSWLPGIKSESHLLSFLYFRWTLMWSFPKFHVIYFCRGIKIPYTLWIVFNEYIKTKCCVPISKCLTVTRKHYSSTEDTEYKLRSKLNQSEKVVNTLLADKKSDRATCDKRSTRLLFKFSLFFCHFCLETMRQIAAVCCFLLVFLAENGVSGAVNNTLEMELGEFFLMDD